MADQSVEKDAEKVNLWLKEKGERIAGQAGEKRVTLNVNVNLPFR